VEIEQDRTADPVNYRWETVPTFTGADTLRKAVAAGQRPIIVSHTGTGRWTYHGDSVLPVVGRDGYGKPWSVVADIRNGKITRVFDPAGRG
jgi:hypothetical protein